MDPPELPDLARYVKNPLLRAELEHLIAAHVVGVVTAMIGGRAGDVPRSVVVGLAERCAAQSELLARRAERA